MDYKNWLKDGILAIIGPIASAWLGDLKWGVLSVFTLILAAVCIFLSIRLFRLRILKKLGIDPEEGRNDAVQAVNECTNSFYFLGVSGNRTVNNSKFESAIVALARKGGDVRFLLMDPNSPNLGRRADDEGCSKEIWVQDIKATITRLKDISQKHGASIKIRFFSEYPLWRMLLVDRRLVYLNYFLDRHRFTDSPQITLKNSDMGLLNVFQKMFDELWESASDA